MSAGEICNRAVITIHPQASIVEAAQAMRRHHVGDIVVVEERNGGPCPIGIVTDRDLVIEVLANEVQLGAVVVGDVMSDELVLAHSEDDTLETLRRMRNRGVRRVPVVDSRGVLVGIITLDDLLNVFAEQMEDIVRLVSREQLRERQLRHVS